MAEPTQKIRLALSDTAKKYARADAPREVRLMASRGALPLAPTELASVLFALMHDSDAEVKASARDSLEKLPENVMQTVLSGETHPAILDHLARVFRDEEERIQTIALNASAADSTIAFAATLPFRKVVEIAANNQERLLRCPSIVESLGDNPLTGRAVIDRILSFLGMDDGEESHGAVDPNSIGDEEARAALEAVLGENFAEYSMLIEDHDADIDVSEGGSLYSLIQNMSVFQKIKLARMGNKEARSLLVRDRNKIVALSAITSPKITDAELIAIAKSRNVSEDVIRVICQNKDVTRNTQVKLALATNPKTPQGTAMSFVNYLQDRDLRGLMKSKDVPSVVSTHARRILTKKGKI